jgi:hypothetical protein
LLTIPSSWRSSTTRSSARQPKRYKQGLQVRLALHQRLQTEIATVELSF